MLSPTILSATERELDFIAGLDYGIGHERHLEALRKLIFGQHGLLEEDQCWYPYEVIELGSHHLQPGREREFAICTLLVIEAVRTGRDRWTELSDKFNDRASDYDALPPALRDEILGAYQAVGC